MRERKEMNVQIGRRIRKAREAARYTQAQLAELIDVSVQFVSDMERGVVGISFDTLTRLCGVLHVSTDGLIFGGAASPSVEAIAAKLKGLDPEQLKAVDTVVDGLLMLIKD